MFANRISTYKLGRTLLLWLACMPLTLFAQPNLGEERLTLNGRWAFKTDPNNAGETQRWFATDFATAGWDSMEVPGNWDLHNEYATYAGKAWYRRMVTIPANWQGKTIRLAFEAVYHDAKVWLNGQLLGESHSGFFPFAFDITQAVKPGQQYIVTVCADNTFRRGAIWNWGGIRRPVALMATAPLYIQQMHVLPVPDLKNGTARVTVRVQLQNTADRPQTVNCTAVLKDKSGQSVPTGKGLSVTATVPARSNQEYTLQADLPKNRTHLWHFDDPYLYTAEVTVNQDNKPLHRISDRFGIRKVEIDGVQLKLNGEPVRLMGYNWVPDDRTTGNTLPAWRYRQDIDLMKKSGANMARLSHLPLPKEVLDYVDEKGMLVFSEIPLWGKDLLVDPENPTPKQWLGQLVDGQYNHPSIIGWCVGNEIGFLHQNPKVIEYVESAIGYVKKELDNSRLVVYVTHSADMQPRDAAQFSDMILLNKYGSLGSSADKAHQNQPGKPMFYSEYGYNLTSENPNPGVLEGRKMLNDMRGRDYLMGGALWTFNDYRSHWQAHESWNTAPTGNRAWGVVNVYRQPKRAYETFRREYAPVRSLTVTSSQKGSTVTVQPRGKLDLPAYMLRNYTLAWQASDSQGKHLDGGFATLPTITPGGKPTQQMVVWRAPVGQIAQAKYSLISPTGYTVYDTTIYTQKPAAPAIQEVIPGDGGVRVVFNTVPGATGYVVRYGKTDFSQRSDTTIHHYVDIRKLDAGRTYQFQVVGINSIGEGDPSATVKAVPVAEPLPPVVWHTEAADSAFFIGYGYANYDYLYEVRYGTDRTNEAGWQSLQITNKGVCRVPNLENGKTYYFRMNRIDQAYIESSWSEVQSVRLSENRNAQPVETKAVLRSGSQALISIHPDEKATGYQVSYQENGKTQNVVIQGSALEYLVINGLDAKNNYSFTVSALIRSDTSDTRPQAAGHLSN